MHANSLAKFSSQSCLREEAGGMGSTSGGGGLCSPPKNCLNAAALACALLRHARGGRITHPCLPPILCKDESGDGGDCERFQELSSVGNARIPVVSPSLKSHARVVKAAAAAAVAVATAADAAVGSAKARSFADRPHLAEFPWLAAPPRVVETAAAAAATAVVTVTVGSPNNCSSADIRALSIASIAAAATAAIAANALVSSKGCSSADRRVMSSASVAAVVATATTTPAATRVGAEPVPPRPSRR